MGKRLLLFFGTNILIIATISILISLLGLNPWLTSHGIDFRSLAIFCAIWGMAGSFISLMISRIVAKVSMGVVVINPDNATREERFLLEIVYGLANKLKIRVMPEVGIYASPELNAFATGPTKNRALVAVSSGLLSSMNRDEIEAVLGHEMSHVANGDMVTMTLIQGVVNAFTLFLSRIVAYAIASAMRGDRDGEFSWGMYSLLTFVLDMVFTFFGSMLVAAFSRWREYRADAGGASLAGRDRMIAALRRLQAGNDIEDARAPSLSALKISQHASWMELFSTHPPLEKRISRLQEMKNL